MEQFPKGETPMTNEQFKTFIRLIISMAKALPKAKFIQALEDLLETKNPQQPDQK